jgi:acyl-coenzyme A synthetase/AMP-(fatty) acid ligase
MGISPTDLNLAIIPFGHSYGLGNLVLPLVLQGTALACVGVPLPHAIAADIVRTRPTIFPAVPALLRALAQADLPAETLASLRTVISAGAPLPAETAREFHDKFNHAPHGFYGSSETGGISYDRTGEATLAGRSVGTPLPGVSITATRGRRIRIVSAAVFRAAGFSPTDHAQIDPAGELCLQGRAGRLVKIAGRRLDLAELEATLRALPGVTDAFVCLHPDQPENLASVLATSLTAGELRPIFRERLASWKTPRRLLTTPVFPLTIRGKTDTRALTALLASR